VQPKLKKWLFGFSCGEVTHKAERRTEDSGRREKERRRRKREKGAL